MPQTPGSAAATLARARVCRRTADRAEAELLAVAAEWVDQHPVAEESDAATLHVPSFGDTGIRVAGEGTPWVAEFAVAEFAAAVGLGTESGRRLLGEAVELRHRLPRTWARVQAGDLVAWRARRVAQETLDLPLAGAGFVDAHVAPVVHKLAPAALGRLVEEARARYAPQEPSDVYADALDHHHVTVDTRQVSFHGTLRVEAELDLADALDLDHAVAAGAAQLKVLGSPLPLGARRAAVVGMMARHQLTLDLGGADRDEAGTARTRRRKPRRTVLFVHLSEAALTGASHGCPRTEVARVENTRGMVLADQVRAWCGHPDTEVVVTPVVDLAEHVRVDQWEVPDRIAEHVALRDGACVFPWCSRPARSCRVSEHSCDTDHTHPYCDGGVTCPCGLAPLCRRHHRLKTHSAWTYHALEPGSYLWTSPHGYQYLRDHEGTLDVSTDRRSRPQPCPAGGAPGP